jgi:DNA-binding transcriptional LysR family regulator
MFDLEIRDLRILTALAENGSLVRAARVLDMSQSGLTRALSALELKVGTRLFDRHKRGLHKTETCRAMIAAGSNILAEVDQLRTTVAALKTEKASAICIASGMFAYETVVCSAAAQFLELKPMVQLHLKNGLAPDAIREVRERRAEMAVAELSELEAPEEFNIEPMRRHPVLLVVRPDHPLTRLGRPAELPEIFAYPTVTTSYLTARVAIPIAKARTAFKGNNMHPTFPAVLMESVSDCIGFTTVSSAVAGATAPAIAMALRENSLVALPFHAPWLVTNFGIITLRGRRLSESADAFIRLLKAADVASAALADQLAPERAVYTKEFATLAPRHTHG